MYMYFAHLVYVNNRISRVMVGLRCWASSHRAAGKASIAYILTTAKLMTSHMQSVKMHIHVSSYIYSLLIGTRRYAHVQSLYNLYFVYACAFACALCLAFIMISQNAHISDSQHGLKWFLHLLSDHSTSELGRQSKTLPLRKCE